MMCVSRKMFAHMGKPKSEGRIPKLEIECGGLGWSARSQKRAWKISFRLRACIGTMSPAKHPSPLPSPLQKGRGRTFGNLGAMVGGGEVHGESCSHDHFRASAFGFPSDFGPRISDFNEPPSMAQLAEK